MDGDLELGKTLTLKTPLQNGMILSIKSQCLDLTPCDLEPTTLLLWSEENNILLRIVFKRSRDEVVFNARTHASLLDGWGRKEEIRNVASAWPSTSKFTISVHDCGDKYQIIFNLTTVHYFHKWFSTNSKATKVTYRQGSNNNDAATLSQSLSVSVYSVNSLSYEEKLAVRLGRETGSTHSTAVSTGHAQLISSPARPFTGLSLDGGSELRIYHSGPGNILQEYVYSAGGRNKGWYQGTLHKLGIILNPDSALAAVQITQSEIRIYYQVPESGFIQGLCHHASENEPWITGRIIAKAIMGSSIAAVVCPHSKGEAVHVYYQDSNLHLREQVWCPNKLGWVSGSFDSGVQPQGTQISATTGDNDPDIHISWKDAKGRIMSRKKPKSVGFGASDQDDLEGDERLDGRDSR